MQHKTCVICWSGLARRSGVTYVNVPWEERHCQEGSSAAKHFNEGGVALLAKLILFEKETGHGNRGLPGQRAADMQQ